MGPGSSSGPRRSRWTSRAASGSSTSIATTSRPSRPDGGSSSRVGGFGSEPGQFNRPSGLAIDADGNLIVADTHNHRLQKLSPDGRALASWGSAGSGPGQFNLPWGVAVDRQGHVYVADWRNDRVQQLAPDGRPLAIFGADGPAEARLKRPSGVAVDDDGLVYVADWGNNLVKIYAPSGALVATLDGDADLSHWAIEYLAADAATAELREQAATWSPRSGSGARPASSWTPRAGSTSSRAAATAIQIYQKRVTPAGEAVIGSFPQ